MELTAAFASLATVMSQLATDVSTMATTATNNTVNNNRATTHAFGRTPGLAAGDSEVNYNTREGASLYQNGIKTLSTPFDLSRDTVVNFEKEMAERAAEQGWDEGTQTVISYMIDGKLIDLLSEYGRIDEATLREECKLFVLKGGTHYVSRRAQNNEQLWRCIKATLTTEAKTTLMAYSSEYELEDPDDNNKKKTAGPLLYKTIMRLSTLDSNATIKYLRANLRELPAFCARENGNIAKVHEYFNTNYSQLAARGCSCDDVETILFDTYMTAVPDATFQEYMRRNYDDWMDNKGDMKDAKHDVIMRLASQKYNSLVQLGHWGGTTKDQQHIVALQAQLDDMKNSTLRISKALSDRKTPYTNNKKKGDKKNKKDFGNKRAQKKDAAWKKIPPKAGEPKTKVSKGRTYHWCHHHMCFTIHTPTECELGKTRQGGLPSYPRTTSNVLVANSAVPEPATAAEAYASIMAQLAADGNY